MVLDRFRAICPQGFALGVGSLSNFKPHYMSLVVPNPMWMTARQNPHEVAKAIQLARFLLGRYRSEQLARHWISNSGGKKLVAFLLENINEKARDIVKGALTNTSS